LKNQQEIRKEQVKVFLSFTVITSFPKTLTPVFQKGIAPFFYTATCITTNNLDVEGEDEFFYP